LTKIVLNYLYSRYVVIDNHLSLKFALVCRQSFEKSHLGVGSIKVYSHQYFIGDIG